MSGAFGEMFADGSVCSRPSRCASSQRYIDWKPPAEKRGEFHSASVDQTRRLRVGILCILNIGSVREDTRGGIGYSRIISLS